MVTRFALYLIPLVYLSASSSSFAQEQENTAPASLDLEKAPSLDDQQAASTEQGFVVNKISFVAAANPTTVSTASAFEINPVGAIFVDGQLSANCSGNYSIAQRNCTGADGNAYRKIQDAITAATAGKTVAVRSGTYAEKLTLNRKNGAAGSYIVIGAYPGESPVVDATNVSIADTTGIVNMYQSNYIHIHGLTFANSAHYGISVGESTNIRLTKVTVAHAGDSGIFFNGCAAILVDSCEVNDSNKIGTTARQEALSIRNTDGFEVAYNKVHDCGEEGIDIKVDSKNGSVHHNMTYNNRGPNIYIDEASYVDVYNNVASGAWGPGKPGIALAVEGYGDTNKTHHVKVYNNLVYDNIQNFWLWPTATGSTMHDITITNNLFATNTKGIRCNQPVSSFTGNIVIRNNIFWNHTEGGINIGEPLSAMTIDYNLFNSDDIGSHGSSAVLTNDVKFFDYNGYDFHLLPESPAKDAGASAGAPAQDFDGVAQELPIDIGPYVVGGNGPAPTCTDNIKNGTETDIDCGGSCPACANGGTCLVNADCQSGNCDASGKCAAVASCNDGIKNGNETDIDCGGGTCATCSNGSTCSVNADCQSGNCDANKTCAAAVSCNDGIKNGKETDIDCGGGTCPTCANSSTCLVNADCQSGNCASGKCAVAQTTGDLVLDVRQYDNQSADYRVRPEITIRNVGSTAVDLSTLKIRYWYTRDTNLAQAAACEAASVGCGQVTTKTVAVSPARNGADYYIEIGFGSSAGQLAGGSSTILRVRATQTNKTVYNETNDYSYTGSTAVVPGWAKVTMYKNATLIWGTAP